MATKRVCDRCGAEINPSFSVTYVGIRLFKTGVNDNDYELCVKFPIRKGTVVYVHPKGRYIVAECGGERETFFPEEVVG